jgi:DNA repair protein RecN (Recombination protein N)
MLALRTVVDASGAVAKKKAQQRTMVFDEIDTGIGGRAAEAVGKKLKSLARTSQVLCVTHLPQIATFADQHYVIEKKSAAGKTKTTVRQVSGDARTEEVARMLSGAKLTDTSRKHAEQLIRANG